MEAEVVSSEAGSESPEIEILEDELNFVFEAVPILGGDLMVEHEEVSKSLE